MCEIFILYANPWMAFSFDGFTNKTIMVALRLGANMVSCVQLFHSISLFTCAWMVLSHTCCHISNFVCGTWCFMFGGDREAYEWNEELKICLLFYILAAFMVISGWVLTCDSAHSWRRYSAAPLGNKSTSTMTWFPSHYMDTEPTSPYPILLMPST